MMKQNYEEFKVQNKENMVHIYIYRGILLSHKKE